MKRLRNKRGDAITLSIITVAFVGAIFVQAIASGSINSKPVCSAYLFDNGPSCGPESEYRPVMTLRPHALSVKGYYADIPNVKTARVGPAEYLKAVYRSPTSLRPHSR